MGKRDHYASKCRKCGNIQGYATKDITKYTFKCNRCQFSCKVHDARKGGFRVKTKGPFNNVDETPTNIGEWKTKTSEQFKERVEELKDKLPHRRDAQELEDFSLQERFKTYQKRDKR